MSTWIEPKTDWSDGDFFNLDPDYNRIKSDVEVLKELAEKMYNGVAVSNMPKAYSHSGDVYVEVPNNIVSSVEEIRSASFTPIGYKEMKTYESGKPAWNASELNAIENNIRLLYNMFENQKAAREKMPIMLGLRSL